MKKQLNDEPLRVSIGQLKKEFPQQTTVRISVSLNGPLKLNKMASSLKFTEIVLPSMFSVKYHADHACVLPLRW